MNPNIPLARKQGAGHRLLDMEEDDIGKTMLPEEIPSSLYSSLGIKYEDLSQWNLAVGYLVAIKMQITQYNDVIDALSTLSTTCKDGIAQYIGELDKQMSAMINKLSYNIGLFIKALKIFYDEDFAAALEIILNALNKIEKACKKITLLKKIDGVKSEIDHALACFWFLKSYILKGISIKSENK